VSDNIGNCQTENFILRIIPVMKILNEYPYLIGAIEETLIMIECKSN